jgi:hypothetical protein
MPHFFVLAERMMWRSFTIEVDTINEVKPLAAAKIENEGLFFDWEYEPIELHVHEIRDDKPNSA